MRKILLYWRSSFFAGLAVVLPVALSIAVILWIFGTVANFTDTLLFFLPRVLTHQNQGTGAMFWYWSVVALLLAVLLLCLVGGLARDYMGRRLLEWMEQGLLRIPLFNRIYGTIKQINDTFTSSDRHSFQQVVLVEFPRAGQWSVGFLTSDQPTAITAAVGEDLVSVFVPTTPNPTSGFLVLMPRSQVVKLDLSVADGLKYIVSLGSVLPPSGASPIRPGPSSPRSGTPPHLPPSA